MESAYPGNVYRAVTERAELELVREPANSVDTNAVAVRRGDSHQRLGYLRADVAKVLAPDLDAGELWVVGEKRLAVRDGQESLPGLTIHVERIDWAHELPLPEASPFVAHSPFEQMRRRVSREDPRAWAARMAELGKGLPVRWVTGQQYAVPSASQPDRFYSVVVDPDDHGLAHCLCHCQSSTCRPALPIPCRHAAAVIDHLVESGYLRRIGGLAYRVG